MPPKKLGRSLNELFSGDDDRYIPTSSPDITGQRTSDETTREQQQRKREEEERRRQEEEERKRREELERMIAEQTAEKINAQRGVGTKPKKLGRSLDEFDTLTHAEQVQRIDQEAYEAYEAKRPKGVAGAAAQAGKRAWYNFLGAYHTVADMAPSSLARTKLTAHRNLGLLSEEDYQEIVESPESMEAYYQRFAESVEPTRGVEGMKDPLTVFKRFLAMGNYTEEERKRAGKGAIADYYFRKAADLPTTKETEEKERSESLDELTSPMWYLERLGPEAAKLAVAAGITAASKQPGAGAAMIAGEAWGRKKKEAMDNIEEKYPWMPHGEKEMLSDTMAYQSAMTEYFLEKLPLGKIAGLKGNSQIANRFGDLLAKKRIGRQSMVALQKGSQVMDDLWGVRVAKRGAQAMAPTAGLEAFEEATAGNLERLTAYLYGDDSAFDDGWKSTIIEAVGGAAIGGPLGLPAGFAQTGPAHRAQRRSVFATEAERLARTPEGIEALQELSQKDLPSRKDYIDAGFDPKTIGNALERKELAQKFTPENVLEGMQEVSRQRQLEQGFQRGEEDVQVIQREALAGDESAQLAQETVQAKQQQMRDSGQIVGPEYVQKRIQEKARISEGVQQAFGVEPEMATAIADVLQNSMTVEETSAITFQRGGKPGETALYQIQDVVKEIVGRPGHKTEGNEGLYFGRDGVFPAASEKVRKANPLLRGARTIVPGEVAQQHRKNVMEAREKTERKQRGMKPEEVAFVKPKDNSPFGREFEEVYDAEKARPLIEEAVRDFITFTKDNPEFAQYYETEVGKEQEVLKQKYPELEQEYNFWFYRMINAVASAQTELSQNTEETDAAYGGFKQTGRVPVVMDTREMLGKTGEVIEKADPVYSLPREEGGLPLVTEDDMSRVLEGIKTLAARVGKRKGKAIPRKEMNILLNPQKKIPKGYKMLDGGSDKKGKDAVTHKDFLYNYFAPKYISAQDAKSINTTSKALTTKLLREYVKGGEQAFRERVRTAFTIYGGSSQYNKARNYDAMNQLLERFSTPEGTPDLKQLVDWLNERVEWAELNRDKQSLGFGAISATDKKAILDTVWTAEGQQEGVPRTFIFGPKVGAYMLNRMADYDARNADYNTMDVWESRFWRGMNPDLMDDAPGIAEGLPRKVYMRQARDFAEVYKEMTGNDLKVSAGQASRWYMMKKAVAEAGYAKAGRDETIAGFTSEVMDRWLMWQLGKSVPVSEIDTMEAALDEAFPDDLPAAQEDVIDTGVYEGPVTEVDTGLPFVDVLFQEREGEVAGSMEQLEGGDILLRGFESADVDTALEEVGHGIRRVVFNWDLSEAERGISDADLWAVESWAHEDADHQPTEAWTTQAEEKFAGAFRKYLEEGNAPNNALQKAFRKIADALRAIYRFVGRDPGVQLTPEVRAVFDQLMRREETVLETRAKEAAKPPRRVRDAGAGEFLTAQEGMAQSEFMDKKDETYLNAVIQNGGRVMLADDGLSGYVVSPEGDLQNLFVNKETDETPSVRGKELMADAMANGARTLDVYRGHLTDFYSNMGWKVKNFTPWNDEFAPEGWDYDRFGTPDYVEMEYDGTRDQDAILEAYKTHGDPEAQFSSGDPVSDALDGYEFNGGYMNVEEFIKDNELLESPQEVIERAENYEGFGDVVYDPEEGNLYFMPREADDVVQVQEEADVRPEDAPQPAAGSSQIKAAGYFQRAVARGTADTATARRRRVAQAEEAISSPTQPSPGSAADAARTQASLGRRTGDRAQAKKAFQAEVAERARGGDSQNPRKLTQNMAKRFGVTVREGRLPIQNAFAVYHTGNRTIRADQREIFDLGIMSHEVAHKIDDMYGITKMDIPEDVRTQLEQLDYSETGDISEGFAEFVRILFTRNEPDRWNTDRVHHWFDRLTQSDAKYNKLREQMIQTREDLAAWRNKGSIDRVNDIFAMDRETDFESVYSKLDKDGEVITDRRTLKDTLSEWVIDDDNALRHYVQVARENYKDMLREGNPEMSEQQLEKRWLTLRRSMGHDPATLHMLMRGTKAQLAERALRNGVFSVRTGQQIGQMTLSDVFDQIEPAEQSEFAAYAFAKSALERMEYNPDYEPGVMREDLEATVNEIEASEKGDRYNEAALKMTQFHNEILDLMVDSGVETQQAVDKAKAKYKYYVPMQRVRPGKAGGFETGSDIMGVGKMMKSLKSGSMRPVMDPRDSLIKRTAAAYQMANAKMVERSIIDLAKAVPGLGHMVERVAPDWQPNNAKVSDMLSQLEDAGVVDSAHARMIRDINNIVEGNFTDATLKRAAKRLGMTPNEDGEFEPNDIVEAAREAGVPDAQTVITTYAPIYKGDTQEHIISTIGLDGKPELYQVSDDIWKMYHSYGSDLGNFATQFAKDVVEGVEDIAGERAANAVSTIGSILSPRGMAQVFKTGATGASMAFGSKNLFMDSMFYMIKPQTTSDGELIPLPQKAASLGRNMGTALQQAISRVRDAASGNVSEFKPTNSDVGNLYLMLGGQFHTMLGDLLVSERKVADRFMNKRKNMLKTGWQTFQDVISATELPARIAAFEIQLAKTAQEGGYKIAPGGKIEGQVPMWAALEALNSAAEATINFKVGGRATRAVEMYFPFTKAAWNANRSLYVMADTMAKNPQARAQFGLAFGGFVGSVLAMEVISQLAGWDDEEERNRWEQEGYINFGPYRVPKVRELAFITEPIRVAVRNAIREMKGKDTTWKRDFGEVIASQMKEHMVVPGITHRSGFYGSLINALQDWDDFKGKPIESDWMKKMDVPSRTDKQVWWLSNLLASGYNTAMPESFEMSPKKVDYMLKNTLAGHQRYINILDMDSNKTVSEKLLAASPAAHFVNQQRLGKTWWDMKDEKTKIEEEIAGLNNRKWVDPSKTEQIEAQVEELEERMSRHKKVEGLIREMQAIHYGGDQRLFDMMTGLARWVMGKPELPSYPNPLGMDRADLPEVLTSSDAWRKLKGKKALARK